MSEHLRSRRAVAVVSLALACAGASSAANALTVDDLVRQLTSTSEARRFDGALSALDPANAASAHKLADAVREGPVAEQLEASKAAQAAVDFVLLKLGGKSVAAPAEPARGVVLVSIDTLRADHLGAYGYERDTTPNIDALAARGAVFERAWSTSSWTLPAHMSMLTGLYPAFHKLERGGKLGSVKLDDSESTLAEILGVAGYATAGIVAHPFLATQWGFGKGFDLYRRYTSEAGAQTERALLWLEWHALHAERGLSPRDFFLFLHYIDPHEPYDAPAPFKDKYFPDYAGELKSSDMLVSMFLDKPFERPDDLRYALALYDGEISYVDAQLGRVIDKLGALALDKSTLFVVTSDHGEEFKDHGAMGHKGTLYEEQLRVPLVVSYPRALAPGQRVSAPVSLVDIVPTVLDLAGLPAIPQAQGVSLVRYLKRRDVAEPSVPVRDRFLFAELGPLTSAWERTFRRKAVRSQRYKLIVSFLDAGKVDKEMFDLQEDPRERSDVYESEKLPADAKRLEAALDGFMRDGRRYNEAATEKNRIELDTQTRERLRALGYLD